MALDLKPREADIRDTIYQYLLARRVFCWRDFQPAKKGNNWGPRKAHGVADILGIYKGKPLAIEVKKPKGEVSVAQFQWLTKFKSAGGIAFIATSIEDVQRELSLSE